MGKITPNDADQSNYGQGVASITTSNLFYLISFTKCSKQELFSCILAIIPNFLTQFFQKYVYREDKAYQCDFCELQAHINCTNLNSIDYRYPQNCKEFQLFVMILIALLGRTN